MKTCKKCGKEITYGTEKRQFCNNHCKNQYIYLVNREERKAYTSEYYYKIRNPVKSETVLCACGCGRTFEKMNRIRGKNGQIYFEKSCRSHDERAKASRLKNVVSKCRYCGLDVTRQRSHPECRKARNQKFLKDVTCVKCGVVFHQTEKNQLYDPACKIIADREARRRYNLKYKLSHPEVAKAYKRAQNKIANAASVKPVAKLPTSRPGTGVKIMPQRTETRKREISKMDEVIIRAWQRGNEYERKQIEANPLNKHLSFQEAA